MFQCWIEDPGDRPTFPDIVSSLTCILDSNDPNDVTDLAHDHQDAPDPEEEPLLHVNPTYLEPMDMFPVLPPPALPTYVNDHSDYENDSETQI